MKVIKATVFDPALSGDADLPARLELLVSDIDTEHSTHVDTGDQFTVFNYGPLAKIFCDDEDWDPEDTEACAAYYNSQAEPSKQVYPVTVSVNGDFWEVYYVAVKRVQTILRNTVRAADKGYELLPDPTYVRDYEYGWYLQHKRRPCIRCITAAIDMGESVATATSKALTLSDPVEVYPHRLMCLCSYHTFLFGQEKAAQRAGSTT